MPLSATQHMKQGINFDYDDRLTLVGYDLDDSLLPKNITLYWTLQEETPLDYQMSLQLVNTQNETIRYSTEFYPYYEIYRTSAWPSGRLLARANRFSPPY